MNLLEWVAPDVPPDGEKDVALFYCERNPSRLSLIVASTVFICSLHLTVAACISLQSLNYGWLGCSSVLLGSSVTSSKMLDKYYNHN